MTSPLGLAVLALGGLLLVLQVVIVVERVVTNRRRRRVAEIRPALEQQFADFVVDPDAEPPHAPSSKLGQSVLRDVAVESIIELSGRERERLMEQLEDMGAIDQLCLDLLSRTPSKRRRAAEALGEMDSPEATFDLVFGSRDPVCECRLACARALAMRAGDEYTPIVLEAVDACAELQPGAAAAVLLSVGTVNPAGLDGALDERRTPALRLLAAGVVGELKLAEHAPALRAALTDPDDELATKAARALGAIGDPEAVGPLLAIVSQSGRPWFCRAVAAKALGRIGDARAVPALEDLLKNRNRWMERDRAAAALAGLGEAGQVALLRARESTIDEVRELAGQALAT